MRIYEGLMQGNSVGWSPKTWKNHLLGRIFTSTERNYFISCPFARVFLQWNEDVHGMLKMWQHWLVAISGRDWLGVIPSLAQRWQERLKVEVDRADIWDEYVYQWRIGCRLRNRQYACPIGPRPYYNAVLTPTPAPPNGF